MDQVVADPPVVHHLTYEDLQAGKLTGVHSTEYSCYRLLADVCAPGSRTLETGSGISTALFASWGTVHRCITPAQSEADALAEYGRTRGIDMSGVTFDVAPSEEALTRLPGDEPPLDVVFVDGNHGFPAPMIDWFYAGGRLRRDGFFVLDDIHLPAVKLLRSFLDLDPRWRKLERTAKWAAWQRLSEGALVEDQFDQIFYRMPGRRLRPVGPYEDRARRLLHPAAQTVRRSLRWSQSRGASRRP